MKIKAQWVELEPDAERLMLGAAVYGFVVSHNGAFYADQGADLWNFENCSQHSTREGAKRCIEKSVYADYVFYKAAFE